MKEGKRKGERERKGKERKRERKKERAPSPPPLPGAGRDPKKDGGYLLSRLRSTIGAAELNCPVRNGKGWNLRTKATSMTWRTMKDARQGKNGSAQNAPGKHAGN